MTASNIWDQVLARIETKVNRHSFYTWFKPTAFVADRDGAIRVRVPNALFRDWLTKHYAAVIDEALAEVERARRAGRVRDRRRGAPRRSRVVAGPMPVVEEERRPTSADDLGILSPRYSFDTFIVGTSNQFAHAACRAVAEAPSRSYNPLFIYGGVGLGKTHLMHAIGHYVVTHLKNLQLTYISSERFMNEMINAVRYDRILDFRERYRSVDVLLVDDVQFLAGKEGTQTEFFHTFNALYDSQKQIVISSDCPPHEIPQLEERLRSRFEWGLIADIQSPDLETKTAILKRKAESEGDHARRQRRDLHRRQDQVEHPRARGIADPPDCLRVAHRPGNHAVARPGRAAERPAERRPRGDDRKRAEGRGRPLLAEGDRAEVEEQLEVGRAAAADRDVSVQEPDERVTAGDRPELRRQAPLDRDSLDPEDRRSAIRRTEISTRLSTTCWNLSGERNRVFHSLAAAFGCAWIAGFPGPRNVHRPARKNPPRYPNLVHSLNNRF